MAELLIGAGSRRDKIITTNGKTEWKELTTVDFNADHSPDVVWDLNERPLPFDAGTFDEIHAYEVLEHLGNGQGDWRSWFNEWSEWYRLLKPGGFVCGTSPAYSSRWVWGDPSHCRAVMPETMVFLDQDQYRAQIGKTPMSDFRFCFKGDFEAIHLKEHGDVFEFVLRAIKPSRI